ncbi:hypothetical protein ACOMHN_046318 [Nucella lapillus]
MIGQLLASTPGPNLKGTIFDLLPLNDVLFTEDVLMEVSARSRIECSKKCAETKGCVMCTFHSSLQGPPGHCRLHSQLQTASDDKQSMSGAKSMARRSPCDGGYVPACDRYLKAVKTRMNYTTARQDCRCFQGSLAMAKSSAEIGCLRSFASNKNLGWTWVGADDKDQAGVFKWYMELFCLTTVLYGVLENLGRTTLVMTV